MKNIFQLTVVLLLVSSCGLFKKTTKTKESLKWKIVEMNKLQSEEHFHTLRSDSEKSTGQFSIQQENLTLLEGEEIELRPDGTLRVNKGKMSKKQVQHTRRSHGFEKLKSEQRDRDVQVAQHAEKEIKVDERHAQSTAKPAVADMLYFLAGLLGVVLVVFWWLRKRLNM